MKATIVQKVQKSKSTFIDFCTICTIVAVQNYLSFYVHNICIPKSLSAAVLILHQEQIVLVHTVLKHEMVIAVCCLDMVTAVRICLAAGAFYLFCLEAHVEDTLLLTPPLPRELDK